MPAVAKTSPEKIVAAARRLVERQGLEALSMQSIAAAVGVKAPSLYRHFADRASLVRAVAREVVGAMQRELAHAASTGDAGRDLRAIALGHRTFALRSPRLYALVFGARGEAELAPAEYGALVEVLLDRLRRFGAPGRALEGARTLVAYTHGFATMELAGAFHLGPHTAADLEATFRFGLDRLLAALRRPRA